MRSYPVMENPIGSAVARSFGTNRHTDRQLMNKNYLFQIKIIWNDIIIQIDIIITIFQITDLHDVSIKVSAS